MHQLEVESAREVLPVKRPSSGKQERSSFANHPRRASEALVDSFVTSGDDDILCNRNVRVLALTATLFITITIAQGFAAEISDSEALRADVKSMAVDAMTYFLNMFVEMNRSKPYHRKLQLAVPPISIGVLVGLMGMAIQESVEKLSGQPDDDVNQKIVLVFAVWGIVFDLICLYAFMRGQQAGGGTAMEINMMTALLHVGADLLRSITTLASALLTLVGGFGSGATDAWAGLIVALMILVGAAYALYEWVTELRDFIRDGQ